MSAPITDCLLKLGHEEHNLEDYQSAATPRWCIGCGDHGILAVVQRLCRDEQLPPEKTVFASGIGCSSRLPHYMNTYGFHGLHGRALPIAEGIKIRRPDLNVFVITGDGDCCSIGAAHWIHAIRYNMDMTVLMHDNHIYGLTKNQASPTSPLGFSSNTSPRGAVLEPLNPLGTVLGMEAASFVAQAADWIPESLYDIISAAFHHKGLSFVRVLQRCPEFAPDMFMPWAQDPELALMLHHPDGVELSDSLARIYQHQENHNPADLDRARQISTISDQTPIGILYRNNQLPCYEDLRKPHEAMTPDAVKTALEAEFDKYAIASENRSGAQDQAQG